MQYFMPLCKNNAVPTRESGRRLAKSSTYSVSFSHL
jgi:hypothetical protein